MSTLIRLLDANDLVAPLTNAETEIVAGELAAACAVTVYPRSIVARNQSVYFLCRRNGEKTLGVLARKDAPEFRGEVQASQHGILKLCQRTHENLCALRAALPFLNPVCIGLQKSIGMGDRLGLATPGHIRAVRGTGLKAILAQQSVREMARTRRTPQAVMDDAIWGVFQEGFRDGFGADADHLKTLEDLDAAFTAGFKLFTIDPGEHVDNAAGTEDIPTLRAKFQKLPWTELQTTEAAFRETFCEKTFRFGYDLELTFSEETMLRAAVKYGRAIAHTRRMYQRLVQLAAGQEFELEMSVDETDLPTSVHEHFYVAHELKRLGVKVVSLAPRFVGAFEKGVDYKGDLRAFESAFIQHAKVAKRVGPHKISIHSGSDKFSIYPIVARHGGDLVHLKTAGTSYLEALRTIAQAEPAVFREILAFAFQRYNEDKASYHVSADLARVPTPDSLSDKQLASVLDQDDARQLLHVTFGSVLTSQDAQGQCRFRGRLLAALRAHEDEHYEAVERHLRRHIEPFMQPR